MLPSRSTFKSSIRPKEWPSSSSGATGSLGGLAARQLSKEGWQVRGITRNKESKGAKALSEAGIDLTSADYDDVNSLEKAFEGATAISGVTNIFEYLLDNGAHAAAEREAQQLVNITTAAGKISTLEHLVLHTLPAGAKLGGKQEYYVPHMDGKDKAADVIKETLPEVAKKSTFLWLGLFSSNFTAYPMMKPMEVPGSYGTYVWLMPVPSDLHLYIAGDASHNTGVSVSAILARPEVSLPAKYVFLYTETGTLAEYVKPWSEITGRRTAFVQVPFAKYEEIWGPYGTEMALMFRSFEPEGDWTKPYQPCVLTEEDLGIPAEGLVGLREALEKVKDKL